MDSRSLQEEFNKIHKQNGEMKIILQHLQREVLEQRNRPTQLYTPACHCLHHQHHLHPHLLPVPPQYHNPIMLGGSLQPLRAGVARGGHEMLPPITSAPSKQQQQSGSSSSSLLKVAAQGHDPVFMDLLLGDRLPKARGPRPLGKRTLAGIDRAHPLTPIYHPMTPSGISRDNLTPTPPAITKATDKSLFTSEKVKARSSVKATQEVGLEARGHHDNGCQAKADADQSEEELVVQYTWAQLRPEALDVAEAIRLASLGCSSAPSGDASVLGHTGSSVGSLSPVDPRTPSVLRTLPPIRTPTPPTAPTLAATPAPPQTAKPQATNHKQFRSRLPRLKKATALNVATAVTEHKSEESLAAGKKEEVIECKEVKKKPVRVAKRSTKPQQTRELPELARLPPVACPEETILQAFSLLEQDDWEQKIEALVSIRHLSQHHAEVLLPRLHDVCLAVNHEVKNLRSMVSRAAMETLAHLHAHLGRDMDAVAEYTAQTLLPKAGEANRFIREDVELGLSHMVLNISPTRSMNALINAGLRHPNAAVRKVTAQHLEKVAEIMGASRLLCGQRDLTDRFIQAISCLAVDPFQGVRTHAHNILAFLSSHPDLVEMVDMFVPQKDRFAIRNIINRCQK